jgi:hypothetical protein
MDAPWRKKMKILAEAKIGFDVETEILHIKLAEAERRKGTMAEGKDFSMTEIFLALSNKFPEVTFILLDDEEKICGWRN